MLNKHTCRNGVNGFAVQSAAWQTGGRCRHLVRPVTQVQVCRNSWECCQRVTAMLIRWSQKVYSAFGQLLSQLQTNTRSFSREACDKPGAEYPIDRLRSITYLLAAYTYREV